METSRKPLIALCVAVVLIVGLGWVPGTLAQAARDTADRRSGEGQLVFWLLALKQAREDARQRVDVNSATIEELRAVPGMAPREALRIVAERPYAALRDLARADLSPVAIKRLARYLAVGPEWPSALPRSAQGSTAR